MARTHLLIGAGKMGGALLTGWLASGQLKAKSVVIFDPTPSDDAQAAIKKGAKHAKMASEIPSSVETVILAVKPQLVDRVAEMLAADIPENALIFSILAGTSIAKLERLFPNRPIVRAMPNTPAAIGAGMNALTARPEQDPKYLGQAEALLAPSGHVERVQTESQLNAVTAVSGSGPAYIFYLCETLEAAARDVGLPEDLAPIFARQTIIGAAKLLESAPETPTVLRQNVTSPNGTTQAALDELMSAEGLSPLMLKTVRAAFRRAKELSGD